MSQCPSISDRYGVQCTAGVHHKSYYNHIWQGFTEEHGENTIVVWSTDESRQNMDIERAFFALAEDMTESTSYTKQQYQTMIADLLIRLAEASKKSRR